MGLNVELLEQSFNLVAPQADALVSRFYERLFQKYPSVKPLFKHASMADQKKKLLASLVLVIQNLRRPDKLTDALQAMGARHVAYGALPAHYDAVGENLLAVLGEFAGAAWTPPVKQAWTEAYGAIKTLMLQGAERQIGGARRPGAAPQRSTVTLSSNASGQRSAGMFTWFGNQKTVTKLMTGFGISGLIMAGIAVFCLVNNMKMRENIENIYAVQLNPLMTLTQIRGLVHQTRANTVTAVLTKSAEDRDAAIGRVQDFTRQIDEKIAAFLPTIKAEEVRKAADEFVKVYHDYRTFRESTILAHVKAGDQGAAIAAMKGEGAVKFKASVEAINAVIDVKTKVAKGQYENSIVTAEETKTAMIVLTSVGIGLGLLFGWLIARFLVRNLADVITAAEGLGRGDLTARSAVTTADEVGTLALAFNNMGENLQAASAKQQEMAAAAQEAAAEIKGVTNAIGKAQAVIEFNMDGTVIVANDNFLNCLGYQLPEIQGHHHRMFCDPAYAATGDYQAFWQKLNRGEFDAGVYRRIGKGGKEVWIQASYNPILDVNGKAYKVMKFATDITAQKNQSAEVEGKINAINKAQAAIEFNLDGTVITANENFLECLGYTLQDIKGQHHRMFCDPAYVSTGEYVAFWQKLNRGEFDAGAYKRIGKGGKEIWIQASYNPIVDANGKVYKVVKFATDITAQKKAQMEQEQLVGEAQQVLGALAEGDLTQPMAGTYQGELEKLKDSINRALKNLTTTLTTVRTAAESVSTGAEQITKGNEDLSQRTSEQASSLEETSSAMEEMTSTVKQNADNAKQANQLAIAARDVAEKGGSVTTQAIDAMDEINKSSKKIADIITVIDEIAFQTNLLALNAAVEAARAGEHGRGFAVVAAEVRNLAQRSATAAKEIKGLINESVQRVTDGSKLVDQSGKTLTEIVGSVKRVTDIIAEITAASQEQASGIDQVNKAIMQMDETTQQNAALVEEATSASQSMKEQAGELMRQVASFKMEGGNSASHARPGAVSHKPGAFVSGLAKKPMLKKPMEPMRAAAKSEPVAAGNGKNRLSKDSEFEEF